MVFVFPTDAFPEDSAARRRRLREERDHQATVDRNAGLGSVRQRRGLLEDGNQLPPSASTRPRGLPGTGFPLPNDPTSQMGGSTPAYARWDQGLPAHDTGRPTVQPLGEAPPKPQPQTPLPPITTVPNAVPALPGAGPTQVAPAPQPPPKPESVLMPPDPLKGRERPKPSIEPGSEEDPGRPGPKYTGPASWNEALDRDMGVRPEGDLAPVPEHLITPPQQAPQPEPEEEAPTPYKKKISTVTNAEGEYIGGVRVPDPGELKAARESGDLGAIGRAYGINPEDYTDPRAFRNDVLRAEKDYATRSRNWSVVPDGMGGHTWVLNENGQKLQEDMKRRSFLRRMTERYGSTGTGDSNGVTYDQLADAYDSSEGDHGDRAGAVNASILDERRAEDLASRRQNVRTRAEQDEMARRMGVPVGHVIAAQSMMNAQSPQEMAQAMFAMESVYPGYGFGERGAYLMDMVASGQSDQAAQAMQMQQNQLAYNLGMNQLRSNDFATQSSYNLGMNQLRSNDFSTQASYNLGLDTLRSGDYQAGLTLEGQRVNAAGSAAAAQAQANQGQPLTPQQQAELEATNPVAAYQGSVKRSTYTEGGLTELIAYSHRASMDERGNPTGNNGSLMLMNGIKASPGFANCQFDINNGRINNVPPQWFDTMVEAHAKATGSSEATDHAPVYEGYADFLAKYGLKDSDSLQARYAQSRGVDVAHLDPPRPPLDFGWGSGD